MTCRLMSAGQKGLEDEVFIATLTFNPGFLPTNKEVIEVMMFHLAEL